MPRQKSTHVDSAAAVGERLREARTRAGLSQRQLAFDGCSPAYVSRIEAGDRIPSLQLLREMGRRLGVSEDWLATGGGGGRSGELIEAEVALRLDELDAAAETFARVLARDGSDEDVAGALAGLGQVAFRRGRPGEAIGHLERALAVLGEHDLEHPDLADTLGRAYATTGETESAIALFERFLAASERNANDVEIVRFAVLLAYALIDSANFGRAEELLARAIAVGRKLDDPLVSARLYWSQSKLHAERNEPEIAARYARKALEILQLTENTQYTALAHQLLAHIELDRNHADEALQLLEEGWSLLERSPNALERAAFQLEKARALARLGRSEEAGKIAMSVSGVVSGADPVDAGRSYCLLAEVFETLNEPARARELLELAAELLEASPSRYLGDVYARLATLAEADGRLDEAYALMKRALGLQRAAAAQRVR